MMSNKRYLKKVGIRPGDKSYDVCLQAMNDYGDNRWWLSEDPKVRAYYQTELSYQKNILLLPGAWSYQDDLAVLLQRMVTTLDLTTKNQVALFQEVQRAWQVSEMKGHGR